MRQKLKIDDDHDIYYSSYFLTIIYINNNKIYLKDNSQNLPPNLLFQSAAEAFINSLTREKTSNIQILQKLCSEMFLSTLFYRQLMWVEKSTLNYRKSVQNRYVIITRDKTKVHVIIDHKQHGINAQII